MRRALRVELMKMRRSLVVGVTTGLIVVLVPALSVAFTAVAENGGAGAVALKAKALIQGEGWDAYVGVLAQLIAVAMFIGPGVVVAWAFGREYVDRTFPSLFALPVSRGATAAAKFLLLLAWGAILSTLVITSAAVVGVATHVGTFEADHLAGLARLGLAGFLSAGISLTVGLVASVGRGYLPAIGALILLTMSAQVAVLFGTGGWFPYAAPGLYAVSGAGGADTVDAVQLLLVPIITLMVAWATVRWWSHAEVA